MRMVIPRSDAKIAFADHIAVGAFLRATNLDWTLVRAAAPELCGNLGDGVI